MASTQCSECDEEIEIAGRSRLGQKIVCNHCGVQLEVVATEPLEVDLALEDDDDLWDDEDDLELLVSEGLDDELEDDLEEELEEETDSDDADLLDDLEDELDIDDEFDDDDYEDDELDDLEDIDDDDSYDDDDDRWG